MSTRSVYGQLPAAPDAGEPDMVDVALNAMIGRLESLRYQRDTTQDPRAKEQYEREFQTVRADLERATRRRLDPVEAIDQATDLFRSGWRPDPAPVARRPVGDPRHPAGPPVERDPGPTRDPVPSRGWAVPVSGIALGAGAGLAVALKLAGRPRPGLLDRVVRWMTS